MLHLRETLTMPSSYYTDITDKASETVKQSMEESVSNYASKQGKSKMVESLNQDKLLKVLKESNIEESIVAKVITKLSEGGVNVSKQRIYRVPVARINPPGTLNGNHRRYPAELWENVMNNQEKSWKGLCGLADHPLDDSDPGSFKNSSIVWLGMEIDKENNLVYGIGTFVGPYGHLAQEIIDAGGRVGFSSSGFGELMSDNETVNPKTYQIERLADVVLNPSQDVYGVINDETNLGNIEYSKKQAVHESVNEAHENRIQENTNMDAKETGVKSALAQVEEKRLRQGINKLLKENAEILNPVKQLEDLNTIMGYVREGQLTDLEGDLEAKLLEAQKKIEEMVDFGMKMKEAEVSVAAGADASVNVEADGAVNVTVGDTAEPVVEPSIVDTPAVVEEPSLDVEPAVEPEVSIDTPAEPSVDTPVVGDEMDEDPTLLESKLPELAAKTVRESVENFLSTDHSEKSPLALVEEAKDVLKLVQESGLKDLEESVNNFIGNINAQMNEDIENIHQMKLDLNATSVAEINESAKTIMKSGKILAENVTDYKELCEAVTARNQMLFKEYNEMKAKLAMYEAKLEDSDLSKNQKIVSLSEKVSELTESFDNLDIKAGEKVTELQESLEAARKEVQNYKDGNAKLEKALGIANTKLKESAAQRDAALDKLADLEESVKAEKARMTEAKECECEECKDEKCECGKEGCECDKEKEELEKENESLKAKIAELESIKESAPAKLDMTQLDETAAREIKILKDEIKSLKTRLGENVTNYVQSMTNDVVSYYNDLEARYGESIKPYKKSFLNATSLREAQRMFMNVAKLLQNQEVEAMNESVEEPTALSSGKVSDFYEGNTANDSDSMAASFGLL